MESMTYRNKLLFSYFWARFRTKCRVGSVDRLRASFRRIYVSKVYLTVLSLYRLVTLVAENRGVTVQHRGTSGGTYI